MLRAKLMVLLLAGTLVAATVPAGTATAVSSTTWDHQAHDCRRVDAYRITTCARARLPASPLGRQLRWVLAQLAGEATTLTEAEVRNHFSAEFFTMVAAPAEVIEVFRSNMAEFGTFTLVGFAYPPRTRQALALVQSTSGERGVVLIPMEEANRAIRGRSDPPTPALSHHQSLCSEL